MNRHDDRPCDGWIYLVSYVLGAAITLAVLSALIALTVYLWRLIL